MKNSKNISRREVIKWSIPFFAAVTISGELFTSCHSSPKTDTTKKDPQPPKKKGSNPPKKGNPYAGKDEMYLNAKTKVLHYPFLFATYDKLKESNHSMVPTDDWQKQLDQNGARFSKEKSGIIFEKLALRSMKPGINNQSLNTAGQVAGRMFTGGYQKNNKYNWRGYEMLLQLTALNTDIKDEDKWNSFSNYIKEVELDKIKRFPPRTKWITARSEFDKRIIYINSNQDKYRQRLVKRMT